MIAKPLPRTGDGAQMLCASGKWCEGRPDRYFFWTTEGRDTTPVYGQKLLKSLTSHSMHFSSPSIHTTRHCTRHIDSTFAFIPMDPKYPKNSQNPQNHRDDFCFDLLIVVNMLSAIIGIGIVRSSF